MFRYHTSDDLIDEINIELLRTQYSTQILVDENDLYFLSESLIKVLLNNLGMEIIIISNSNKKSLKLFNLCKRLIDGGAYLYWYKNNILYNQEAFFGIFDKSYVIGRRSEDVIESAEEYVRSKTNFFKTILLDSEKIKLLSGEIEISFEADRTIVYKNESVNFKWEVRNADHVGINNEIGDVPSVGEFSKIVKSDITFELFAKNKDLNYSKKVYIRTIETKDIEIGVSAYDPVINEEIPLESSSLNPGHYGVYFGQEIKMNWSINMIGKFREQALGNLPLEGSHAFEIFQETKFIFTFNSLEDRQIKNIIFHPKEDEEIFNKLHPEALEEKNNIVESKKNTILYLIKSFFAKLLNK